jgi:hypothetical protein
MSLWPILLICVLPGLLAGSSYYLGYRQGRRDELKKWIG